MTAASREKLELENDIAIMSVLVLRVAGSDNEREILRTQIKRSMRRVDEIDEDIERASHWTQRKQRSD